MANRSRYQGGASFNVFSAQGSNPTGDCKVCGKGVQKKCQEGVDSCLRAGYDEGPSNSCQLSGISPNQQSEVYDKSVKGYVYSLNGGPASKLQLPKDDTKAGLQLLQHFLVFQLFVPAGQHLSLELRVTDTANTRRKMYFSTSFNDIKSTPLHCQIPLALVTRNIWLSLSMHVADLFYHIFRGMSFRSVDVIVLGPVCKLRKIFTMRSRLVELGSGTCGVVEFGGEESLPPEHMFAFAVDATIQVLDMAALQMAITGIADPSYGVHNGLTARKPGQNKLEPRQVHVAFGSRMPLPLSTVQINTNLPGDSKPHMVGGFSKDRLVRNVHEAPAITQEQKRDLKTETVQSLLKRANIINNDLRKEAAASDLKLSSEAVKEDGVLGAIAALTSLTMKEFDALHPREHSDTVTEGSKPVDEEVVPPTYQPPDPSFLENEGVDAEVGMDAHKSVPGGKWMKVLKKRDESTIKRDQAAAGLGKYTRRDSHMESSRGKEYRQTRYMDSPPESPPCGWTSYIGDDMNEEKPFSERVFEGLSLFSKPSELDDPVAPNKDTPGSPVSGTLSSCSSKHSSPGEQSLKSLILNKDSLGILDSPLSLREFVNRASEEGSATFIEDRPRPVGVAHEKFDLGNDDNFVFQDSAFAGMSDDEFSGGQSWSSGSSQQQQPQGDSGDLLTLFPETSTFLNDEDDSEITWNLECSDHKEGEQDREFGSLEQQPWTLNDQEEDGDCNTSPSHLLILATENARDHDSFNFDSGLDYQDEELALSPTISRPNLKIPRDINLSVGNNQLETRDTPTLSSSWQLTESCGQHSLASCSLKTEEAGPAKPVKESSEREGLYVNGRLEEDLDLLYDPTLDCYYDPKTNRYYELK